MPISQSPLQETFGQAPIEAMAAGLPVVVTDWDGCRHNHNTVRHGEDGILVPTLMAPSGEGREASLRQATSNIYYGTWLSLTARLTAVDIGVAAEAFRALAGDPSLRRRMGAAGQARVKGTFDWAAVIPRYLALWREQAIRLAAPVTGIPVPDPRYMDPNQACAAWPSGTFRDSLRLRPDPAAATTGLLSLVCFTAPALPGERDDAGITGTDRRAESPRRDDGEGAAGGSGANEAQRRAAGGALATAGGAGGGSVRIG
jgi:starch synthase